MAQKRFSYSWFFGLLATVALSCASADQPEEGKISKATEEIRAEVQKLKVALAGDLSPGEKLAAMKQFRAKLATWQENRAAELPPHNPTAQGTALQSLAEWMKQLPSAQKGVFDERFAFRSRLEGWREESKNLPPPERDARLRALMDQHRNVLRDKLAAREVQPVKDPQGSFSRSLETERQNLKLALTGGNPQQKQEAIQQFRTAAMQFRETRSQETEQLLKRTEASR